MFHQANLPLLIWFTG